MHLQIFDYKNKYGVYNFCLFSIKKKEKTKRMRFLPKAVTICFEKKEGFNCKNNYKYTKLANFWLDNSSKINYKRLVVLS